MSSLLQDVRYAVRTLLRSKTFSAVAVATLAIGIGLNTAVFSIVNAVLLRPLPFGSVERLFVVYEQHPAPVSRTRLSSENFLDLQRESRAFDALAGYIGTGFTFTSSTDAELVIGQLVSAELFDTLGVQPLLGRALRPEENEGGRDQVLLLGYALWQRRFGGDPSIVGRTVTVNARPYTVVGVMPREFVFPSSQYELWAPFAFRGNPRGMVNRHARFMQAVGRLRPGVSPTEAGAELAAIADRLQAAYPRENADMTIKMASLVEETTGQVRPALALLWSVVGFVLLIACGNVTNLLLARASAREREVAVRTALGAGRWRIVRQLLTETLVLYTLGALAGLLLAAWSLDVMVSLSPEDIPRLDEASLDRTTLLFTMLTSAITGVIFGMLPAIHTTRPVSTATSLGTSRSLTAGRASLRVRGSLVGVEVALSLMLLVGAGLATRSLQRVLEVDPGLRTEAVLTFNVVPPEARYPGATQVTRFHGNVLDRLRRQPGVLSAGASTHLPLSGQNMENSFTPEGWQAPSPTVGAVAGLRGVAGDYFHALGIRINRGRGLADSDTEQSQLVAVVSEQFARAYWPEQDAVGKRLKMGSADSDDPWRVVVGVYADVKHSGLQSTSRPEVMLPYRQAPDAVVTQWFRGMSVVVHTAGDPMSALPLVRDSVRGVDPGVPIVRPQRMSTLLAASAAPSRFRSRLLLAFGGIAAILAFVGIYGVVAFNVEQRTREIGLRLALGAQRRQVLALIVRQGALPITLGLVGGIAGGLGLGRAMRSLLFQVGPADLATVSLASALFTAVAVLAMIVPARRAMGVQPATALRSE